MDIVNTIEWCASWVCPKCSQSTDQVMDYESIEEYDGAVIKVKCPHNEDNGDDESLECNHEYLVDLRG